ncbi:MAG: hypothetical protein ACRD3W_02115, partial [Terriglobales bacterium]
MLVLNHGAPALCAVDSVSANDGRFVTPINGSFDNESDGTASGGTQAVGASPWVARQTGTAKEELVVDEEAGWSLPILGQLGAIGQNVAVARSRAVPGQAQQPKPEKLSGSISAGNSYDRAGARIDELLEAALDRDPRTAVLDQAVKHYRKTSQKVIAETKDATDYLIPYRGFGPSSEAGDVILDEKVKLKSRASAEFARQKQIDETHIKVVSSVMQLAMGLGMTDQTRGEEVTQSGYESLKQLVGDEEADRTKQELLTWSKGKEMPESVTRRGIWDVTQKQDKHKLVVETSLDEDPVVTEIKRRLHKYNQKSKLAMASSHVIQATLGAASLTPTFIGPAAKTALLAYIMATGGPEQVKIMKELYLDKRFESRCKVVNEEAHLALDNYEIAI